jgi:hypothetical protein
MPTLHLPRTDALEWPGNCEIVRFLCRLSAQKLFDAQWCSVGANDAVPSCRVNSSAYECLLEQLKDDESVANLAKGVKDLRL